MGQAVKVAGLGKTCGPVATPYGPAFFQVEQVRRSYEELKPEIDNLFVQSQKASTLFELRSKASIRYQSSEP
jgi:hypothetical protein